MAFPTVALLDTCLRSGTEEPPSKSGFEGGGAAEEWKKPSWFTAGAKFKTSSAAMEVGAFEASKEYGAYWSTKEYTLPFARIELGANLATNSNELGLWACLQGTEKSGYRASAVRTAGKKVTVKLTKYVEGTPTELGSKTEVTFEVGWCLGITVREGKVKIWAGKKGEETVQVEVADTTYESGYVAIFGSGSSVLLKNFEVLGSHGTLETYFLEPIKDAKMEWTSFPTGAQTAFSNTNNATRDPTEYTATGVESKGEAGTAKIVRCEFQPFFLRRGEQIRQITLHVFARCGTNAVEDLEMGGLGALGSVSAPANQKAKSSTPAWYKFKFTGLLYKATPAEIETFLSTGATLSATNVTSVEARKVYDWYMKVETEINDSGLNPII